MRYILPFFIILFLGFSAQPVFCQVDRGGVPRSFQLQFVQKSLIKVIDIASPDLLAIQKEDMEDASREKPYRVGVEVPVKISPDSEGQWDNITGGARVWRATIRCKDAQGIGLNYSELRLPEGSDLFVYTPDHSSIIGAITAEELPDPAFTTRPLRGDELVIEYYQPAKVIELPVINISGIVYMYRGFETSDFKDSKFVSSGSCEVNVNCKPEGDTWQNEKRGVVKILTKVGAKTFYCSGSVVNNTLQDFSGLILTAGHCSEFTDKSDTIRASVEDYKHWIFYFNYEYSASPDSACPYRVSIQELTTVGARKLATSAGLPDFGSDFLLVKSLKNIPAKYKPFYCGWDMSNSNSSSGVSIHHPGGDVKKISTYNTLLGSGSFPGSGQLSHWIVKWAKTTNGYGVTEGGSSGSPLFDKDGLVIGTLSGGGSNCSNLNEVDNYGKVSYSWISNGTNPGRQLKPWLDSINSGITKMPGSFNESLTVADFSANSNIIPVGGSVNFYDLSSGKPIKWHWYFQGGKPYEATDQNPTGIVFERYGKMNVKLVVTNALNSDSIVKEGFIDVRAIVSPNPSTGSVSILSDINNTNEITIEVFDAIGKMAQRYTYTGSSAANYTINLPDYGNLFIIRIIQGNQIQTHKVVVVH